MQLGSGLTPALAYALLRTLIWVARFASVTSPEYTSPSAARTR